MGSYILLKEEIISCQLKSFWTIPETVWMWDSSLKWVVVPKCNILSQFFLLALKWKLSELQKRKHSRCRIKKIRVTSALTVWQELWDLQWLVCCRKSCACAHWLPPPFVRAEVWCSLTTGLGWAPAVVPLEKVCYMTCTALKGRKDQTQSIPCSLGHSVPQVSEFHEK